MVLLLRGKQLGPPLFTVLTHACCCCCGAASSSSGWLFLPPCVNTCMRLLLVAPVPDLNGSWGGSYLCSGACQPCMVILWAIFSGLDGQTVHLCTLAHCLVPAPLALSALLNTTLHTGSLVLATMFPSISYCWCVLLFGLCLMVSMAGTAGL
jgi:hypothetical protein